MMARALTTLTYALGILLSAASPPPCLAQQTQAKLKKYALVMGNSAYSTPISGRLDAEDVAAYLEVDGFEVGKPIVDNDFTGMKDALKAFAAKIADADMVAVFFSGHGFQFKGDNYLMPVGDLKIGEDHLPENALQLSQIVGALSIAEHATKLIILDACRDTSDLPLADGGKLKDVEGWTQGLAELKSADNILVAYSAIFGQTASARGPTEHSPYSEQLLASIREPGLELRELLARVHDGLAGKQTTWDSGFGGMPARVLLREPVKIHSKIVSAQGTLFVVLNKDEVMNSRVDAQEKVLELKAGPNEMLLQVLHQKSFRNGHPWEKTEGWSYDLQLTRDDDARTGLECCSDGHDAPFRDGPEVDNRFTAARVFLNVDKATAALTIKVEPHLWNDQAPFYAKDEEVLYQKPAAELLGLGGLFQDWQAFVVVRGNRTLGGAVQQCIDGKGADWLRNFALLVPDVLGGDPTPGDRLVEELSQCVGERVWVAVQDQPEELAQ